jgi:ribosomal protein L19E
MEELRFWMKREEGRDELGWEGESEVRETCLRDGIWEIESERYGEGRREREREERSEEGRGQGEGDREGVVAG